MKNKFVNLLFGKTGKRRSHNQSHYSVYMAMIVLFLIAFIFQSVPEVKAQTGRHPGDVMTRFNPKRDGFRFPNTFKNDIVPKNLKIPSLNIHTKGLCGGMDYVVLDYYFSHKPIPKQAYRPATGTKLAKLIYHREVRSIESNVPEWTNMMFNPGGKRNVELFRRGLNGRKGGALATLKNCIDRGIPIVLDMKGAMGTGDHQVIAYGYNMGRYKGKFGPHQMDLKIYICDPNHPQEKKTLIPDLRRHVYHYTDGSSDYWRSYFVDTKYKRKTPPSAIPNPVYSNSDGKIHELILSFHTGNNDLRGGHANINLEVEQSDGSRQFYRNINKSARWLPDYTQNARVVLRHPVRKRDIRKLIITDTFRSGINHDTWRMGHLDIKGLRNNNLITIGHAGPKYFTIKDRRLEVPISSAHALAGQIDKLNFTFHTGGDALRGNHANLNVEIHYADGSVQTEPNVNHGAHWANNSTHIVSIHLDRAVRPQEIKRIVLITTASPGFHSDKWNMDSVQIIGKGNHVQRELASHGFKRFTPKKRKLIIATVHS
ncbi:MAG TPA: hypothetical protein VKA34_17405 [Balneolales bacterium]|nr:hypothetical protein [Balneolales bacterium]